ELAYQYAKKGTCLSLVARRKHALEGVAGRPGTRRAGLNHLVANAGAWSICFFDEITNITASTKMMDVNFWGSVYPTYYALPHLKASKGKLIVSSSIAATAPTSRLSLYNATKAAQLRFYETLRSELGSEVGVTTLTAGFVESEMTKGKAIQRDGEVAVDEEARDVQIGVFPVARVQKLCKAALNGIRRGDCPTRYTTPKKGSPPLSQRMLDTTGAKRFYPPSLRHHPGIKMETTGDHEEDAASNV
uniref:Uncharacterized protein n=2 Tax=Setaria TaxID=4554 RepID=A0A0Q3RJN3_SETIT